MRHEFLSYGDFAASIYACQNVVERLTDNGDDFLFTFKEASHKALSDFIDGAVQFDDELRRKQGERRVSESVEAVRPAPSAAG